MDEEEGNAPCKACCGFEHRGLPEVVDEGVTDLQLRMG